MSNASPLIGDYIDLVLQKKALEVRIKELDKEIRPLLMDVGLVTSDKGTLECKSQAGRKSLDKKAVAEAGIDLEPFYKVGAPFTTLTVKELD